MNEYTKEKLEHAMDLAAASGLVISPDAAVRWVLDDYNGMNHHTGTPHGEHIPVHFLVVVALRELCGMNALSATRLLRLALRVLEESNPMDWDAEYYALGHPDE